MSTITIKDAQNGWIVEAKDGPREPAIFEFDGANRFRTTLELRMVAIERCLTFILSEMVGSSHYKLKIMEDIEDVKPNLQPVDPVSSEALSGGLPASG